MTITELFKKLWNGGLNPRSADPGELAERRTYAAISFVLVPCSLILIGANVLFFEGINNRIFLISLVMVISITGLYLTAFRDARQLAATMLIAALWLAPVMLMFDEGFSSSNWAWILPVILLANYLLSRQASIIFTALSVATLTTVAVLTGEGRLGSDIDVWEHSLTVAISGSLIFILACVLGYYYRTSQLMSQQRLRRNVQRLAEEVEVRRRAEEKALAGERAKATFLTTVSHELRTPLNGVIGASQLLSGKELEPESKELVDIINNSAEILLEFINNVLDISRMEEGKLEFVNRPMNLEAVIRSGFSPLLMACREKGLDMDMQFDADVDMYVTSDATRIRQLILNLCGNAVKFTREGRVDIVVSRGSEREGGGYMTRIAVRDTGIGIPYDKQEDVFKPFSQADDSIERKFGGSGLGLTIVARLVSHLDGTIALESVPGEGSTFTVELPLDSCAQFEVPVETGFEKESEQRAAMNVLVTDDNLVNRKVANKLLRQLGCNVLEAADGFEALDVISEEAVDLVLMDVQMPNMDGLTATARIRQMSSPICDTPIIGLTANVMPGDEQEMLNSGMDSFLAKPVRLEKLQQALKEADVVHTRNQAAH